MKQSLKDSLGLILLFGALYGATAGVLYFAVTKSHQAISAYDPYRMVMFCLLLPVFIKYVIQLLGVPCHAIAESLRRRRATSADIPTVSVCIPAWNEEVGIIKTIRSVLSTNYPKLEVVIINDGSTDSSHEQISQFISDYQAQDQQGARLQYLHLKNGGKAKALNAALQHVSGEIVITVDADSVMDTQAIQNLVARFTSPKVAAVAGNVIISNKKKPIEWIQQMEYLYGFFFKRTDSLFNSVYIIGGAAAAYRREVLQAVGGFDHTIITEDIEMSTRILAHGYQTRYASDAVIYTEGPSDLKGLGHQRLRWKYGRILTFIKHRKLFFSLRKQHNPYLTCLILPMAVYSECLLLLEAIILSVFVAYTVHCSDYMPLAFMILLLATITSIQVLVDSKARFHRNLLVLAPLAWLVYYTIDLIEFQALIRALKRFAKGKDLKWQKWARIGVLDEVCTKSLPSPLHKLNNELNEA